MESVKSESSTFVEEFHARKVLQELWRQCKSEEFCDVVLIAGTTEERIPAHSNILSAASKYFKGVLSPNTAKEVKISSVDADVIQSLVKYCYTGRITVSEDIVFKLLKNANATLMTDVIPACANFLIEQLLPTNCLGFQLLAEQYGCEKLLQKARGYSLEHFVAVSETSEFLRLNAKQLSELLACDNLNVSSEENVFNSLLSWLRHDPIDREQHQAELLKLVRLPLLKKSFLLEAVKPICTSMECREIYVDAIEQHLSVHCVKPTERKPVKSGKPNLSLMGITVEGPKLHLGVKINHPKIQIHYHCPQRLQWMKWSKDLAYREGFGVAFMEDNLFIVGGQQRTNYPLNTVICLNLKTMYLKQLSQMLEPRVYCGAAVLNGFLYVVGGINNGSLNSIEKWNPKTNTWSAVCSMLVNRYDFGLVALNEKLYAIGGYDYTNYNSNGTQRTAECYDPRQNKWTSIAPMHNPRHKFGLVVSKGLLYAIGGTSGANIITTVERYNPEYNCWTMLRSMTDNLVNPMSCTSFRNKVIVCYNDRVEEYHEETNEWKTNASLKVWGNDCRIFTYSGELLTSEFVDS